MDRVYFSRARRGALSFAFLLASSACARAFAQAPPSPGRSPAEPSAQDNSSRAESELQAGSALTQTGRFSEAIPHFLAAQGHVSNEYAAGFNLALCYVGTDQFPKAIPILAGLRNGNYENASVENLLAQAYAGNGENKEAFEAFQKAVVFTPKEEKLYLLVAAAFSKKQNYVRSLRVVESGLQNLPDSPRLHYELGYILWQLDEPGLAKPELERATSLAPHSEIGYLAAGQGAFMLGNLSQAIQIARTATRDGFSDYQLLALLGDALIQVGASPGKPEFLEAKEALEKSIAARPNYASSQIALGRLLLQEGRVDPAIEHLELGRQLAPHNPTPCWLLATAYRKRGQVERERAMLALVAKLNEEQAQKHRPASDEDR